MQLGNNFKFVTHAVISFIYNNGIIPLFSKLTRIWKREGFSGIKNRIRILLVAERHKQHSNRLTLSNNINNNRKKENKQAILELTRKIDLSAVDILSIDVFDTAVIRIVQSPHHVFKYVELINGVEDFKYRRINAENFARKELNNRKDIDIGCIYKYLDVDENLELNAELFICKPNPIIFDLYSRAIILKKKIYFTSDMYLTSGQVEKILSNCGYKKYNEIFVSSMDDLIKGDGSRFQELKEINPSEKILHIGDNIISDYEWPKRLGITSFKFPDPNDFYKEDLLLGDQLEELSKKESIGISFLMGLYRYWKYSNKSDKESFWRDIGFFYGGPLIFLFVRHIDELMKSKDPATKIYFLARDGSIIKKIYEEFFQDSCCQNFYLLASRRAMTFPLFSKRKHHGNISKLLQIYSVIDKDTTSREVFDRLGYAELDCMLEDLRNVEKKRGSLNSKLIESVLDKYSNQLNRLSENEYNAMINYLTSMKFFEGNSIVVDVGWSGTIQDCLNIIIKEQGRENFVEGVYLGVSPNASQSDLKSGFLFDAENSGAYGKLHNYFDFIELLTAAPEQGVFKFNSSLDFVEFSKNNPQEELRFKISKEIQRGIIDFGHLVNKAGLKDTLNLEIEDFVYLFDVLKSFGGEEVASAFDEVRHSRMPSSVYSHPIFLFDRKNAKS